MRAVVIAGQSAARAVQRLQHLRRRHAAALPRSRPQQGADAGRADRRRVHRAAGHARRAVRQRLQPVRPHLAGQHPGRPGLPQDGRRHLQGPRAQRPGRDGADPLARLGAPGARAGGADPLQPVPERHHQRVAGAGLQHGRGARRDGAALGEHAAGRLRLRMDRHRRCRRRRPPARPPSCSASPCCSPICSWSRCTRAGTSRSRSCSRSAWRCSARWSRWSSPG